MAAVIQLYNLITELPEMNEYANIIVGNIHLSVLFINSLDI